MTKRLLFVSGLALILIAVSIGGYFGYTTWQAQKVAKELPKAESQPQVAKEPEKPQRAGKYEVYDATKITEATDGKVVLFFYASWSKPSKLLDKELSEKQASLPKNFTILKVDYNKNPLLKKQYQVPFENTFVQVDAAGVMVNRWSGSEQIAEIVALAK